MNNLLIKLATGLRCFYDTLTLVDYENWCNLLNKNLGDNDRYEMDDYIDKDCPLKETI